MSYNPYSLENKTILVTGASSGIGKATAIECSKMGARLIITGRDETRLKEAFEALEGTGHKYVLADLTSSEDRDKLIDEAGDLDGLVFSVGKVVISPVRFASADKFKDTFEVNFFSLFELLRILIEKKKLLKGASVVFVSSTGGNQIIDYGNAMYGASKAALNSVMKYCALEFAVKKIRINSVNPGMVHTSMTDIELFTPEQVDSNIQKYPLKRYGEPEEIAWSIIFLLSDASSWITGTELIIDGGISI